MNKPIIIPVLLVTSVVAVILTVGFYLTKPNVNVNNQTGGSLSSPPKQPGQIASPQPDQSSYIAYTPETYSANQSKKRVLFFYASWCPTCQAADKDINSKIDQIPTDVVILKTNYDTESELKKKYNITYQHTFVYVDENGNEIDKWNGGELKEIINKTE